jgi:hypothetical protein
MRNQIALIYHESITLTDRNNQFNSSNTVFLILVLLLHHLLNVCEYVYWLSNVVCTSQRIRRTLRSIERLQVSYNTEGGLTNIVAYCFLLVRAKSKREKTPKRCERERQRKNDNNTMKGIQTTSVRIYIHHCNREGERRTNTHIGTVDLISVCV